MAVCLHLVCISAFAQESDPLDALVRPIEGTARRASSANPDLTRNGDARSIEPGATLELARLEGPGVVTHFWNTLGSEDPFYLRNIVLRVYYDGSDFPSVEVPLGDFFGMGAAAHAEFQSLPVQTASHGRSRACYWRMPFRKSLRMTVSNDSPEYRVESFYYYLDWRRLEALPDDTLYFHAQYRQQHPAQPGTFTILDTGHYAGVVYSGWQMETGWFGEGDDFFYIDGSETPQLAGTGTEDYFNDAWGFRPHDGPYSGVPVYEGVLPGDRVSVYRWHLADPVPFHTGLRMTIEHRGSIFNEKGSLTTMQLGTFEERADWLAAVAFWYQTPPVPPQTAMPPVADRVPPHTLIQPVTLSYRADPPLLVVPAQGGLLYAPGTAKAGIEFDFSVSQPGRYRLDALLAHVLFGGVYQVVLDGRPIGAPVDLCASGADMLWRRLDTHDLSEGKHTLRFEGVEQPRPHARALAQDLRVLAFQRLLLTRLEDCAGYRSVTDALLKK
jgi:hypothetical protein